VAVTAVAGLALGAAVACTPSTTTTGTAAAGAPTSASAPGSGGTGSTASASADPTTSAATTPSGASAAAKAPYATQHTTVTLVDTSRPTEAGAQSPARPTRTLETTVWTPTEGGPFPLIVFSHGLSGHPDKFTKLLGAWTRAGFVVAAPAFPLTNDTVPGSAQNWTGLAQQPNDVRFVIDEMLRLADDPTSPVHHRILKDQIGAGGLSLGGATTYGVVFNDCCRDTRIKSAEVLSGAQLPVGGGENRIDGHVPLLVMHGDKDLALPYSAEVKTFTEGKGPMWFVTLTGGTHAPPFEDDPSPWDELDEKITTDFWLGTLGPTGGDPAALARMEAEATAAGLSSLQKK
jgi:dienelactone hydrolase